jgi:hypothetical protein
MMPLLKRASGDLRDFGTRGECGEAQRDRRPSEGNHVCFNIPYKFRPLTADGMARNSSLKP